MKIKEFEKHIQKTIDKGLTIKTNFNTFENLNGVYYLDKYIGVALPPSEILPKQSEFFCDKYGNPYRSQPIAERDIRDKLRSFKDAKYKNYIND